ncbi:hypothetical protein ACFP7A_01125 [Sporolactobacillus kofuensis]|uniref:Uncharacterized protein n=1 Tax=Sporolactobacillus kofuensis TaxID=269672 RepID=A0ABW1WD31_9BACL|nr:hypothetical protein [Sporolactobacillus kofuensis]MCO7177000.1 hypothetical protein [Sporolactobacillus kofuensis]
MSDFERKVKQILLNDRSYDRSPNMDALEQRTGHDKKEIEETIKKLREIPRSQGGLGL